MSGEIQAIEGKISELSYLPRLAADGGMVEARVLSGVKSTVVRLAPVGVLKQKQLALREGDSVFLNRYLGDGMKGEFLGATEVGRGARRVPLRDSQSRLVQ